MALGKIIGRVAIKVLPDTSDFRDKTANDLRRIEKQLGNLEVDVIPELDKAAKAKLKQELRAWAKGLKATVKLDVELDNKDLIKTAAGLQALTKRRNVKIAPELDNGAVAKVAAGLAAMSGLRYVQTLFRSLRNELMNLDKAVPKIGVVSHAIAGLGAWVLGVSGNLFSLSSSLASMGKAFLALPGILGGLVVGLATTAAALADFNKQVPQAARYVAQLQDTISQNFWAKAADPIRDLVDNLFPILNKALKGTSSALGTFFANLAGSAEKLLLPKLPGMFANLTESIKVASGFTDAFVGIIEKLGTIGASYLPRLAEWFGQISTQFDNWLGTADITGMIEEGITAMRQFGSATASLFSIFQSLGQAAEAAGGSTLKSLSEGLYDIARAAESPGFQSGLTDTLKAAYDLMGQIANIAGPAVKELVVTMAERFQSLGPTIGDTIGTAVEAIASALSTPAVTEGLEAMFEGFNNMVHVLAPQMDLVAEKFAVLGKLVGALAENIGVVMAAAIETLKPIFISLVEALLPVIEMLGPMLAGVIEALEPLFAVLGKALGEAAKELEPLFQEFQKLIDMLMPVLVPALTIVASILGDALVGVIQGVTWAIQGLVKIIEGVIDVFKGFGNIIAGLFTLDFGRVWDGLKQVFSGLGQILVGALQAALGAVWAYLNGTVLSFFKGFAVKLAAPFLKGPLGKIFGPIADGLTKAWNAIKKVWDKIRNIFKGGGGGGGLLKPITDQFSKAADFIKSTFGIIRTVVSTAWKVIQTIFSAALKVIGTVVKTYFKIVGTLFKTYFKVWQTIVSTAWKVISTVFSTAFNVIKTIVTGAFNAIKSAVQTAMDAIYFLFKGPWDSIAEFLSTTWATIRAGFMLVWDGIRVWLETFLNYQIVRFQTVWEAIRTIVTTVWNAISAVISTVLTVIKTVVTESLAVVKNIIKVAWNAIKSASKATWDAISKVISKVWNGIKNTVTTVVRAVQKVIKNVWDTIKSATSDTWNRIKDLIRNAWNSVKSVVSGAVNAVKSTVSGAWNTVRNSTSSAWNRVKSLVTSAWSKIKTEVRNGVTNVVTKVKEIPTKIKNVFRNAGTMLLNAGKDIIGGLIDGIDSMIGGVKDKLGSLTSKLTSWKGPPERDKVILTPAGRQIIEGLIRGFEDRFSHVKKALTGLTSDIETVGSRSVSGISLGIMMGNAILAGLQDSRQQILDGVVSIAEEIANVLRSALSQTFGVAIQADYAASAGAVQPVNLDRRLGGLERRVTNAARSASKEAPKEQPASIHIDNITIPLEDLAQLKDLEEFLDMLRVRIRQGVA